MFAWWAYNRQTTQQNMIWQEDLFLLADIKQLSFHNRFSVTPLLIRYSQILSTVLHKKFTLDLPAIWDNGCRIELTTQYSFGNPLERRKKDMLFSSKEKGQGLVEYALILVLVAIVVIAALLILGPMIGNVFSKINSSLSTSWYFCNKCRISQE